MIRYRLHNITNFGVEIHDFHTEKALNNYIAIFVDPPFWVEDLETGEREYKQEEGLFTIYKEHEDTQNVSSEIQRESELKWINRHMSEKFIVDDALLQEDKCFSIDDDLNIEEPTASSICLKLIILIWSVILIFIFIAIFILGLSIMSYLVEFLSSFNWKIFYIL